MSDNQLNLIRFEAHSFMGIDKDHPVILDFSKLRKEKNITIFSGNQGVGKSSTMNALMFSMGLQFDWKKENIINLKDDTVSLEFEFEHEDGHYRVRVNKSKFSLEKWMTKEKVWIGMGEPKATLKKILGNVATSPMHLKDLDGRKQIKWLREYFSAEHEGPGRMSKEDRILAELDQWTGIRRNANREYDRIQKALLSNDLYINREKNHERFKEVPTIEGARERLREAQAEKSTLEADRSSVINLKNKKENCDKRIADLKRMLQEVEQELKWTDEQILEGETKLKEKEERVDLQYATAIRQYETINHSVVMYNQWKAVLDQEEEMNSFETMVQDADVKKDELRKQLLELTKKYLPKMKGLKLHVWDGIDDKNKKEGIFFKEKSLAQLSESELWEVFLAVCVHNEVTFVFIENVSSLGSSAVEQLNDLASKGVKIFASEQNRKVQELKITITDKID